MKKPNTLLIHYILKLPQLHLVFAKPGKGGGSWYKVIDTIKQVLQTSMHLLRLLYRLIVEEFNKHYYQFDADV